MDYLTVDKNQFQYGKLKKYEKNYFCHVVYEDLEPLCVQTPTLTVSATGITKRQGRAFVDLEVPQESSSFVKFIRDIDQACVNKAHKNCQEWFKKNIDVEDIKNAYQSIIAYDSPPTLHLVLTNVDNIYNHRGEKIPANRVKSGSKVRGELEFIGIWVTANWIGGFWELKNLEMMAPKEEEQKNEVSTVSEEDEIESFKRKYKEIYPDSEPEEEPQKVSRKSSGSKKSAKDTSNKKHSEKTYSDSRKSSSKHSSKKQEPEDYSDDYSDYSDDDRKYSDDDYSDDDYSDDDYSDYSDDDRKYSDDDDYSDDDYSDDYSDSADDYKKSNKSKTTTKKSKTTTKKAKNYDDDYSDYSDDDRKYSDNDYSDDDYSDDDYRRKREVYSDDDKASYEYSDDDDYSEEDPIDFKKLVYDPNQKNQDKKDDEESEEYNEKTPVDKDTKKVNL